jgi:hypothetical protein
MDIMKLITVSSIECIDLRSIGQKLALLFRQLRQISGNDTGETENG